MHARPCARARSAPFRPPLPPEGASPGPFRTPPLPSKGALLGAFDLPPSSPGLPPPGMHAAFSPRARPPADPLAGRTLVVLSRRPPCSAPDAPERTATALTPLPPPSSVPPTRRRASRPGRRLLPPPAALGVTVRACHRSLEKARRRLTPPGAQGGARPIRRPRCASDTGRTASEITKRPRASRKKKESASRKRGEAAGDGGARGWPNVAKWREGRQSGGERRRGEERKQSDGERRRGEKRKQSGGERTRGEGRERCR